MKMEWDAKSSTQYSFKWVTHNIKVFRKLITACKIKQFKKLIKKVYNKIVSCVEPVPCIL